MIRLNRRPMESEFNRNYILTISATPISDVGSIPDLTTERANTTVSFVI